MGQVVYRGNLSAAAFPLLTRYAGQSIIVKQYDNTFFPTVASQADADKDAGIPQIMYCHNVMPFGQGFASVAYKQQVADANIGSVFSSVHRIRNASGGKALFAHTLDGRQYVSISASGVWTLVSAVAGSAGETVTTAYVEGETYIYISHIGCYKYDFGTNALTPVTLNGLTATELIGIVGVSGYLVAFSSDAVAWSSTTDITDFVPSLSTGAGGGGVDGAKGAIVHCSAIQLGFVVYTQENAVAALYSGNSRYPFQFREIVGSGGLANSELIASDGNTAAQYAYTTNGLQSLTAQSATVVFPEVTDFVAGRIFEDFDTTTKQFVETKLSTTMKKKLALVANRYIVISYGILRLTHALVYDIAMKRWGKLKVDHVDCFEWAGQSPEIVETPKDALGFVSETGKIVTASVGTVEDTSNGVLVLGKFQYIRQRNIQMQTLDVEAVEQGQNFSVSDLVTYDGKTYQAPIAGTELASGPLISTFGFGAAAGINHTFVLEGAFTICGVVLAFNVHGRM